MLVNIVVNADVVMVTVYGFDFISAFLHLRVAFDDFAYSSIYWSIDSVSILIQFTLKLSYFLWSELPFDVNIYIFEEFDIECIGL